MAEKERLNQLRKKNIHFALDELEKENRAMLSTKLSTTSAEEDSGVGARVGAGGRGVGGASLDMLGMAPGKDTTMGNSLLSSIHRDPQNTSTGAVNSSLYLQVEKSRQTDSGGWALNRHISMPTLQTY